MVGSRNTTEPRRAPRALRAAACNRLSFVEVSVATRGSVSKIAESEPSCCAVVPPASSSFHTRSMPSAPKFSER